MVAYEMFFLNTIIIKILCLASLSLRKSLNLKIWISHWDSWCVYFTHSFHPFQLSVLLENGILQNHRPTTSYRLSTTDHHPIDMLFSDHQSSIHRQVFQQPTAHRLLTTNLPTVLEPTHQPLTGAVTHRLTKYRSTGHRPTDQGLNKTQEILWYSLSPYTCNYYILPVLLIICQ